MAFWYGLQPGGASRPGPVCPFRWGFPVYASPSWDTVNAWRYAGFKQKTCARGILFKGKSFGEVPMAILKLLEFPNKRGQSCTPVLCSKFRIFLAIRKKFACDRTIFAYFPKLFARITKNVCLNYEKFCVWPRPKYPIHLVRQGAAGWTPGRPQRCPCCCSR